MSEGLTDGDMVNYAYTVVDKVRESEQALAQIANNTPEQAMLGDFSQIVTDAVLDADEAHQKQKMELLVDSKKFSAFMRVIYDMVSNLDSRLPR